MKTSNVLTMAKYKAKEAIRTNSSQYTKKALLGFIIVIVAILGSQFVWIYFLMQWVAKNGMLESHLVVPIISTALWFFLLMGMFSKIGNPGLNVQDNDAHWIFTTGVTAKEYVLADMLLFTVLAVLFTAPLMFVPAVALSTLKAPMWHMVLFPIGLIVLCLMIISIVSLVGISMTKNKRIIPIIIYSAITVLTIPVILTFLSVTTSVLVEIPELSGLIELPSYITDIDVIWDNALVEFLPTTLLARILAGSMVGSFELMPLLASGGVLLGLVLLVLWASAGYQYEYKPKITKEKKYTRKKMRDPLVSKHLLLIKRKKAYVYPALVAVFYMVIGYFVSSFDGSMMSFFAAFLIMTSSQTLTQQILINERMWILKSLGLSGKKVVSSMLKVLIPLSIVYLPTAAVILIIGNADLWVLLGILAIALIIPPYMIWISLKFKSVGYQLSSFGSIATVMPVIVLPQIVPFYVFVPVCILIGVGFYYLFFKLASKKWDDIWEEVDFAAKFGQKVKT